MINALVILAIIILFICYDFLLSVSRALWPSRSFEFGEKYSEMAIRRIFSLLGGYRCVKLEFEKPSGLELPDRFLLVANHQSLMDIPVCMALFPGRKLRFVAKRELGDGIPLVSLILRSQGHALVKRRGDATQAMHSILRFARRCEREGTCPVIFPEGTRSRDGRVGTFHTAGARKILDETPLPLVIAVLEGGWRIATIKDLVRNLRGARFQVRVLSVTPTISAKKDVLSALARAHDEITAALVEMRSLG
jgi:1-acyl-sn-glycerol-3-phosphate acyltransferase